MIKRLFSDANTKRVPQAHRDNSTLHLTSSNQTVNMKRSSDNASENQTKKPKSPLQWVTGFRQKVDELEDDRSLNVTVSYGFENGSLQRVLIHVRNFKKNYPTSDGFSFKPEEVDFILQHIGLAMMDVNFKKSHNFGNRNVILKSFVENSVSRVAIGTRRDRFSNFKNFSLDTLEKLIPALRTAAYICNHSGINLPDFIFDSVYASMIFYFIEISTENYTKKSQEMLENQEIYDAEIEEAFDFFDSAIMTGVYKASSAFGIKKSVVFSKTNIAEAKRVLRPFLENSEFQKDSFHHITHISRVNLVRNLQK